jgi:hypothetical protein
MKTAVEIITAIILLASGTYIAPELISEFKMETIKKVDKGFPPLQVFTKKLTK